jgi:ureidoacrylate peracid hydrolase
MGRALLVMDLQNGFCHPDGSMPRAGYGLPGIADVIRANVELVAVARELGLMTLFTRHGFRADLSDAPDVIRQHAAVTGPPLVRGSWDADLVSELDLQPTDLLIDKNRYDAFLYTDLELLLRARRITELIVSGVVTNVCVESTVRSAEQRGFHVSVAADCTAAMTADFQSASLAGMAAVFATVAPWRELLAGRVAFVKP